MTVERNSPFAHASPHAPTRQAAGAIRVSINLWLSPITALVYVIAAASRHGGIPTGNFFARGWTSSRLVFVSHHFLLDAHIYRYSARSLGVRSTIDWTSLQGQGRAGRSSDRAIYIEKDELARNLKNRVSREEGPFAIESVFRAARGTGRGKWHPIIGKRFADITRHATRKSSWPCAPIRKAPQALSAGHSRETRSRLLSFLSIVPNINPRQQPSSSIFAA